MTSNAAIIDNHWMAALQLRKMAPKRADHSVGKHYLVEPRLHAASPVLAEVRVGEDVVVLRHGSDACRNRHHSLRKPGLDGGWAAVHCHENIATCCNRTAGQQCVARHGIGHMGIAACSEDAETAMPAKPRKGAKQSKPCVVNRRAEKREKPAVGPAAHLRPKLFPQSFNCPLSLQARATCEKFLRHLSHRSRICCNRLPACRENMCMLASSVGADLGGASLTTKPQNA